MWETGSVQPKSDMAGKAFNRQGPLPGNGPGQGRAGKVCRRDRTLLLSVGDAVFKVSSGTPSP